MDYSDGLNARPGPEAEDRPLTEDEWADRRSSVRFAFKGSDFRFRIGSLYANLRLRDLSCGGASGISEMPLERGDIVYMELDKSHSVAARVLWARRFVVGISFLNAVDFDLVRKIHKARTRAETRSP